MLWAYAMVILTDPGRVTAEVCALEPTQDDRMEHDRSKNENDVIVISSQCRTVD